MRPALLLLATGLALPALAPAQTPSTCAVTEAAFDQRAARCPLAAAPRPQRYVFRAHLSGGHDDTSADMSVRIGDAPARCTDGGKLSLFGEDGDIFLECRFVWSGAAGALEAALRFRHAQYERVELVRE